LVSRKGVLPDISHNLKISSSLFKEVLGVAGKQEIEPIKTKEMLMLNINTTITVGVVEKIKGKEIDLSLNIPIIALKGDNVGIARNFSGHWRLIGWGEIIQ
jgi:translation initiation factor 2 gamma subunit (eIF-2gamma)